MSAFRFPEEGFDEFGQFLDAPQCSQRHFLHFLFALYKPVGNVVFDMRPGHLIRIQLRRVGRQEKQTQLPLGAVHKRLDRFRAMTGTTIDNQKHRAFGSDQQAFEKLKEHTRRHRAFVQHEVSISTDQMQTSVAAAYARARCGRPSHLNFDGIGKWNDSCPEFPFG